MLLADLQPASFRGVRFLVPSDDTEEGRNTIRHSYPDASFAYLEDNGRHPPEFKLTAILTGPGLPGKFAALRNALTRPGPGMLKHPYYGSQYVMVDGKFRVSRDDRDAGVLELDIPFSVTGPPSLPGAVSGVAAYVSGLATSALTSLFDAFKAQYGDPLTAESTRVVADIIRDAGLVVGDHFAASGEASANLVGRADVLARDAEALATELHGAVRQPLDAIDVYDADSLVIGFSAMLDTAADMHATAAAIQPTTADRIGRADLVSLIATTFEAAAFMALADAMAARTYTTADAVERDEAALTAAIDALQDRTLSADMHRALLDVHVAASEVLQRVAVRLPRLAVINLPGNLPASVLTYNLHESDARLFTVVDLNLDQNPVLLTGSATVLME